MQKELADLNPDSVIPVFVPSVLSSNTDSIHSPSESEVA
jgi:hypothetical protein